MNFNVLYVAVLLLISYNAMALNILGIFPYNGKSHFIVFEVYLKELAKRGHNLTVISHFPQATPNDHYHDISLAGTMESIEDNSPFHKSYFTLLEMGLELTISGKDNCEILLANKQVQNIVKKKQKFDIMIMEQFNSDCALGIAHKLKVPVVSISSHVLMPWHYNRLGIPNNPSFVPFHFTEGGTRPTLRQKFERIIFDVYFKSVYYFISQRSNQKTLAQYYDDIPLLEDLARDIKFSLLYHNFILTGSRLFPANVIEVGGFHVKEAKPLSGDLLKFVEEAEHGIIYISFGSVVKSSTMPEDKLKAILDTISELPQRFIWKWEDQTMLINEKKLYLSTWLPQVDILGHPKTMAFLSHAGMGSTTEALYFGVPIVAMPVLGDQPSNAAAIEESGVGVQLQIEDLTKENLKAAFKTVLDSKFRDRVKLLSKAWHDRPMSPMDTAVYWTEYAARYSNLTFRTAAADLPFYEYLNLDVIAICVILLFSIAYALKLLIMKLCCSKTKKDRMVSENKRKTDSSKRTKRD